MITLAVSLVWIVAIALLWREAKPLLQRRLDLLNMALEVSMNPAVPAIKDNDPMPQEFVEWAMQESSEWAREDKLTKMRELYQRLKSWPKVRNALMAEDELSLKSTF